METKEMETKKDIYFKHLERFLHKDLDHSSECPVLDEININCQLCRIFMGIHELDPIKKVCPCHYYGPKKVLKIAYQKLQEYKNLQKMNNKELMFSLFELISIPRSKTRVKNTLAHIDKAVVSSNTKTMSKTILTDLYYYWNNTKKME